MKTTLAILIAGLVLLTTPMLALAHGNDYQGRSGRHSYGWSQERHEGHHDRGRHFERHRDRRVIHVDRHLSKPAPRTVRRVYAGAPLVLAPARVVLHIGW